MSKKSKKGCRTFFGLDKPSLWCKSCHQKRRCTRSGDESEGDRGSSEEPAPQQQQSKRKRKGGGFKNPPAVEISKENITEEMMCEFCHMGETKDILQSGRLYKLNTGKDPQKAPSIKCLQKCLCAGKGYEYYHYFCCLFSSQGVQRGRDEEGINGFLAEDLKKEVRRGESLVCDFCGENGATIECHRRKSCKKRYHFSCGALCTDPSQHVFIFRDNMDSYCYSHAPRQKISVVSPEPTCLVCLDTCGSTGPGPGRLVSPCCGRTYHRDCVQKTALQAGKAALKCPACNDKERFMVEMEQCGVYIPHADAQWEMPENSNFYQFDDMLNMYRKCDSLLCSCPHGREFSRPGSKYEIIKCVTCGQSGVHVSCGKLETGVKYTCDTCQPHDSDTGEDSEAEDRMVREKIEQHENRRKHLLSEKQRILSLIEEDKKRLMKNKEEFDKGVQEIRSILADSDSSDDEAPQVAGKSSSTDGSAGKGNKNSSIFFVSSCERYATNMPRRTPSSTCSNNANVPDTNCDNKDVLDISDSDEDYEEVDKDMKFPRIEAVCGGSEAKAMNTSDVGSGNVTDLIEIN